MNIPEMVVRLASEESSENLEKELWAATAAELRELWIAIGNPEAAYENRDRRNLVDTILMKYDRVHYF